MAKRKLSQKVNMMDKVPKSAKRVPPKGGSRKGVPNKVTKQLKDMILGALSDAGGQDYLATQARDNPNAFLSLIGRIVPTEVKNEITGSLIQKIERTIIKP